MDDDLCDAVAWAVAEGHADPGAYRHHGASYGGYATLVGLTRNPELYACGVDIVGPSNLETLLRTIPPYWESIRADLYRAIGNIDTAAGLAQARERSPLFSAANIRKPLLIAQGANDPRVKQAESDQMVAALRAGGIPVTYVLFPDEGHGFVRPENAIACNALIEEFLARILAERQNRSAPKRWRRARQRSSSTVRRRSTMGSGCACVTRGARQKHHNMGDRIAQRRTLAFGSFRSLERHSKRVDQTPVSRAKLLLVQLQDRLLRAHGRRSRRPGVGRSRRSAKCGGSWSDLCLRGLRRPTKGW